MWADASLSADVASFASFSLVLLVGWAPRGPATRSGVNLHDSASISRALHESQHDVPADASLRSIDGIMQLLDGGHLAECTVLGGCQTLRIREHLPRVAEAFLGCC